MKDDDALESEVETTAILTPQRQITELAGWASGRSNEREYITATVRKPNATDTEALQWVQHYYVLDSI